MIYDRHIHQISGVIGFVTAILFLCVWPVSAVLLKIWLIVQLFISVFWYLIPGHALVDGPFLFIEGFFDLILLPIKLIFGWTKEHTDDYEQEATPEMLESKLDRDFWGPVSYSFDNMKVGIPAKNTKTFCVRVNNQDVEYENKKNKVWQSTLASLVKNYCCYRIVSNIPVDQIQQTDYKQMLSGAEIIETYILRYPSKKENFKELVIFVQIDNIEKRGLKDLRFLKTIGVKSLTITKGPAQLFQTPVIEVYQIPDEIIFNFHLTENQKKDLMNNKNMDGCELNEINQENFAVYKTDTDTEIVKPKYNKKTFYVKFNGWDHGLQIHKDKVWHTILETLVYRNCRYLIRPNEPICDFEKIDCMEILNEAEIQKTFISWYPSQDKRKKDLTIYGKIRDVEKCGLMHLQFHETYGVESLRVDEPQGPLIFVDEDSDSIIAMLSLSEKQKEDLVEALRANATELQEMTQWDIEDNKMKEEEILRI